VRAVIQKGNQSMKTITGFCLLIVSCAFQAYAYTVPLGKVWIKGLFGVDIGQRLSDVKVPYDNHPITSDYRGICYRFYPTNQFRGFTSYRFYIGKESEQIRMIKACMEGLKTKQEVWDEEETVLLLFKKKFGIEFTRIYSGAWVYQWDADAVINNEFWYNTLVVEKSFGPIDHFNGSICIELTDKVVEERAKEKKYKARKERIEQDTRGIDAL